MCFVSCVYFLPFCCEFIVRSSVNSLQSSQVGLKQDSKPRGVSGVYEEGKKVYGVDATDDSTCGGFENSGKVTNVVKAGQLWTSTTRSRRGSR